MSRCKYFYFLPIFFFIFSLSSLFSEEEIVVRLSTEIKMLPVAIFPIQNSSSNFDDKYLDSLRSVLVFDMNINGMTAVEPLTSNAIADKVDKERAYDATINYDKWKETEILYLIKMKSTSQTLSVKIISLNGKAVKLIEGITLTGNLGQDRRTMHRIADSIHQILFQKPGIASSKVLYTLRKKASGGEGEWTSEIYEADYDGANARMVTHEGSYIVTPAYIAPKERPNEGTLLFVSYKIGQPKLFYVTMKDGKTRRVTTLRGNQLTPAISSDGSKIAFTSDITGAADLFFVHFNPSSGSLGKPRQIFTAKGTTCASPTFSPDGEKIAFVCNKDGAPKIYVMEIPPVGAVIKDVHPKLISKRCRENSSPCWSPDGKKIAYSSKTSGSRQIWIYDFETNEERQLTDGAGDKENPSWAENSCHLVFNCTDSAKTELYLANTRQHKSVKITSGEGEKRFPC